MNGISDQLSLILMMGCVYGSGIYQVENGNYSMLNLLLQLLIFKNDARYKQRFIQIIQNGYFMGCLSIFE